MYKGARDEGSDFQMATPDPTGKLAGAGEPDEMDEDDDATDDDVDSGVDEDDDDDDDDEMET